MQKKGQVTIFIIIRIMILTSIVLIIFFIGDVESNGENSPFGFMQGVLGTEYLDPPMFEFGPDGTYRKAEDLGMKWHRGWIFIWSEIQQNPDKDEYVWNPHEHQLENIPEDMNILASIYPSAIVAYGFVVGIPIERYWEYHKYGSYLPREEYIDTYIKFVKALVERYDGDGIDDMPGLKKPIKYWQVENEVPKHFPAQNPIGYLGNYAEHLKITYTAIKEADPEAKVVMGAQASRMGIDIENNFDKHFVPILDDLANYDEQYFDIFDIHWYGKEDGNYRGIKKAYEHIKEKVDERGLTPPEGYWLGESGTYSGEPKPFLLSNGPLVEYPYQTEKQHASELAKRYIYPISLGFKKIFWSQIKEGFINDELFWDFVGFVYDGNFEHDKGKGVKKLAYYTYKLMTDKLEGSDWDNVEKVIDGTENIYAYKFVKKDTGKPVWVAWWDYFEEPNTISKSISINVDENINFVKITEAIPNAESGADLDEENYPNFFKTEIKSVDNGKVALNFGGSPIFIQSLDECEDSICEEGENNENCPE